MGCPLSELKLQLWSACGCNEVWRAGYLDLSGGLSVLSKEMGGLVERAGKHGLKTEAHIPPLLGVAPLGIVPLNKEHQFQYR